MPPNPRHPATNAPTNPGALCSAVHDLKQVAWTERGERRSREFLAGAQDTSSRALFISLLGSGARDVSTNKIPARQTYTVYGEF